MGNLENFLFEVYPELEEKGLLQNFDTQIQKMKTQEKHRYKTMFEIYEYAYARVTNKPLPINTRTNVKL